jgi:hypothetical protein
VDQHIKEVEIGEDWRARRTEEERARTLKEYAPVIEAIAKEVGVPCIHYMANVGRGAFKFGS